MGKISNSHPDAAVQYIYTENSYGPLARVDSHGEHADIFWYHTELNGLPDSVTDSNGDTVWRGASSTWGRSLRESAPVDRDTPQNLRFQGQYLDRETGLHYNTFRYYDPAGGCYTQMDPIGLAGGLNTYTYVVDPLGWVDPLGLSCLRAANGRFRNSLNIGEEMASLPNFSGKMPGQIRRILRSRGYTSSPVHSGGEIWMKNLPHGNTASIRIDPRKVELHLWDMLTKHHIFIKKVCPQTKLAMVIINLSIPYNRTTKAYLPTKVRILTMRQMFIFL
ncbi:RHS repeat-associated core domain-containing protein [Kosakonia cowanii]